MCFEKHEFLLDIQDWSNKASLLNIGNDMSHHHYLFSMFVLLQVQKRDTAHHNCPTEILKLI